MRVIVYIVEGLALLLVSILIFNLLAEFLQLLGLFKPEQIPYIGSIAILLALDNLLMKSFFGYKLVS
ncbi:MAG TPA: hypothetical protein VJH95_01195 [Candidatus Nanoarchaeia archaeon]|nr:hypothetical protein [Candidatus Nanoarchaeia archaeon]